MGAEELAAVVGGEGEDRLHLPAADERPEGAQDFELVDAAELGDQIEAGLAFDEDQQAALAVDARDDRVHFPVAELGPAGKIGPVFDGQVAGLWAGPPDGSAPACARWQRG